MIIQNPLKKDQNELSSVIINITSQSRGGRLGILSLQLLSLKKSPKKVYTCEAPLILQNKPDQQQLLQEANQNKSSQTFWQRR